VCLGSALLLAPDPPPNQSESLEYVQVNVGGLGVGRRAWGPFPAKKRYGSFFCL